LVGNSNHEITTGASLTILECISESTGRPLLALTIADIGLDEGKIEAELVKWFTLAEAWQAIMLIDEAEIFLEKRKGADIARNGLVSGKDLSFPWSDQSNASCSLSSQDGILSWPTLPDHEPHWSNR
jgi:hypothetical protein